MSDYIVVAGPSKNGETMHRGLTFVAPHLFPTETTAKKWVKKLQSQNPKMRFLVLDVSGHHLPVSPDNKKRA